MRVRETACATLPFESTAQEPFREGNHEVSPKKIFPQNLFIILLSREEETTEDFVLSHLPLVRRTCTLLRQALKLLFETTPWDFEKTSLDRAIATITGACVSHSSRARRRRIAKRSTFTPRVCESQRYFCNVARRSFSHWLVQYLVLAMTSNR